MKISNYHLPTEPQKRQTAIYPPSKKVPFGLKLLENAYHGMPGVSFFDGENQLCEPYVIHI